MGRVKYFDGTQITIKESYGEYNRYYVEDPVFKGGEVYKVGGETSLLKDIHIENLYLDGVRVTGVMKTNGIIRQWRFCWDAIEERIPGERYVRDEITREMMPLFSTTRIEGKYFIDLAVLHVAFRCPICGKLHLKENRVSHETPEGDIIMICDRCQAHLRVCPVCGRQVMRNEMEKVGNRLVCRTCARLSPRRRRSDGVTGYTHTKGVNFIDIKGRSYVKTVCTDDKPFFGVELEIEHGDNPDNDANTIKNFYPILAVETKHDGSLGWGSFELVTQPMTLNAHIAGRFWKRALDLLTRQNYQSHDGGRCGLHIHIGRKFFGDTKDSQLDAAVKMNLIFVNNYDWIVKFSRRSSDALCDWAEIPDTDDIREIEDYTCDASSRYRAVNVTRDDTIELRVFRGSLKLTTVLAAIEFVDWLARFVKEHDLYQCEEVNLRRVDFGKYKNLSKYVTERGLV